MSTPPVEGFHASHESHYSQAEVDAVIQTIGPILEAIDPLTEQIKNTADPRLAASGWEVERRHHISGLSEESAQFNAGYYPTQFGYQLLRGAAGEALRTLIYYPPGEDNNEPSQATIEGYSSEGKFSLFYDRGYRGAGVSCVMPTGMYRVGFNLTNGDIGVNIVPRPFGQVRLKWSGEEGTVHGDPSGLATLDKERFEILPVTSFDPREHNLLSYSEAMAWYANQYGSDEGSTQLESWLIDLQNVQFQELVATARQQAELALTAMQAVITDPKSGRLLIPDDYEALQRKK